MNYKIDGWAEEVLAISEDPTQGVIKVAENNKDVMTEEMVRRLVEATNVRSFLDKKAMGHNMEESFPIVNADTVIASLVKDNIVKSMPKAASKEDTVVVSNLPDYYAGYCQGVNEKLDFVGTEKRASYNPSGFIWESQRETTRNIDRTKIDVRIKKEAHIHAAMAATEYIVKFAEYYSTNDNFVAELRYLYPNSYILKNAKLHIGNKKIPRATLESHKIFKQADDIIKILVIKKKVKLAADTKEYRELETKEKMLGLQQKIKDREEAEVQKLIKDEQIPLVQQQLKEEQPKAERVALGKGILKSLGGTKTDLSGSMGEIRKQYETLQAGAVKDPLAVKERAMPSSLESKTELAGLTYQALRNQLGNIGTAVTSIPKQMPGYEFGKEQLREVKEYFTQASPFKHVLSKMLDPKIREGHSKIYEENTKDVVEDLQRRANFENIILNDEILENADVDILLGIYEDANKLAPNAMLVPSISKAILRSAHSHGTGSIDPESARVLVKLEKELTGHGSFYGD